MLTRWILEEDGQTLVEYGLIISLVALAVIAAATLLGQRIQQFFGHAGNQYPTPP